MSRLSLLHVAAVILLYSTIIGCSPGSGSTVDTGVGESHTSTGSGSSGEGTTSHGSTSTPTTGPTTASTTETSTGETSESESTGGSTGGDSRQIGEWSEVAGECPPGVPRVDLSLAAELVDATRGEGAFADDSPDTCYFIHDGDYVDTANVLMWVRQGGLNGAPRLFVGESREGVVIRARATVEADHVQLRNMTFDISGYPGKGSFNTITIKGSDDVSVSHVTLTGDCQTGSSGGHIEVEEASHVLVECCLIERFGRCDGDGHLDHGIYLASGTDIEIQNNLVRENSSRGIQLNTQAGEFGTLASVLIENNRIVANGHRPYEDGIAINARETGTVSDLTIQHNLIYDNFYSGLRFVGAALSVVTVTHNTFYMNGAGSEAASPSELNLDDIGSGADTLVSKNIFLVAVEALNSCYDAGPRGFVVSDNLAFPDPGAPPECVQEVTVLDPEFADAPGADFHATAAGAGGFGAYP